MSSDIKLVLLSTALLGIAILLQSTIFEYIAIGGVKPDLSLIILVFIAIRSGSMVGQISGFAGGLIQDILSLPPLGFYSLIRTIVGFLYGLIQGSMFVNSLFVPILFIMSATLVRGVLSWLIAMIFSITAGGLVFFGAGFWIEVAYNSVLAPFLFALLNLLKAYKIKDKGEV